MTSAEHFIFDLTTPQGLDYTTPEGVIQRVDHDLAIVIGSLASGGRYFKAADAEQVAAFALDHSALHSQLRTAVVGNLEMVGISTDPDISPASQADRRPAGYIRLSQPPTEPFTPESLLA
jgi:hypothetical protein